MPPWARLCRAFPAGAIDEDTAHGLGCRGEEVAATVPLLAPVRVDQPQVRLVDQGRGLERLAGLLLRQPLGGQLAELVVDQRQELLGGLGVAVLDGREDARDVVHCRGPRGTPLPPSRRAPEPVARIASPPGPGGGVVSFQINRYAYEEIAR